LHTLLLSALARPLKTQHNCTLFYDANQGKNAQTKVLKLSKVPKVTIFLNFSSLSALLALGTPNFISLSDIFKISHRREIYRL